ncbi:MAG: carbohydrate ABC transporter permease [Halanaerobiales bacterium]
MKILSKKTALLFILPALLLMFLFLIFPAIWTMFLSVTDYSILGETYSFIGLDNFRDLFSDSRFWDSVQLTFTFVFGSAVIGQNILGLSLALLFYKRNSLLKSITSNLVIISWIIPSVVVAYLWRAFLNPDYGSLNQVLNFIGFSINLDWINTYPMISIIIFNTWRGAAFAMMLYMSALENIPPSYLETADVIGATLWRKFWDIIFPSIKTYMGTCMILITLWTFNVFTPYLLTAGGPGRATEILPIYTYFEAFKHYEFGFGSAISLVILVINLIFALFYFKLMKGGRQ